MPLSSLSSLCHAIEWSSFSRGMENPGALLPGVEALHILSMALLVGSIATFDLRLLGLVMRRVSVSRVGERLLPCTWTAFSVNIVTGALLFPSLAETKYCFNPAFRLKLVLILLAGLNMSVFYFTIYRHVSRWDNAPAPPVWAKLAGTLSLFLWAGVVIAAKWISF